MIAYGYFLEKVGKHWHIEGAGGLNSLYTEAFSYRRKDEKGSIHIIYYNGCQMKRLNSSKCSHTPYLLKTMRKTNHTGMKHIWTFVSSNLLQRKIKLI